jgi:hypothetical protein
VTKLNAEIQELNLEELDTVPGGFRLGPFHFEYSKGADAIDIGFGNVGIWFGRPGFGWYAGDVAGHIP